MGCMLVSLDFETFPSSRTWKLPSRKTETTSFEIGPELCFGGLRFIFCMFFYFFCFALACPVLPCISLLCSSTSMSRNQQDLKHEMDRKRKTKATEAQEEEETGKTCKKKTMNSIVLGRGPVLSPRCPRREMSSIL